MAFGRMETLRMQLYPFALDHHVTPPSHISLTAWRTHYFLAIVFVLCCFVSSTCYLTHYAICFLTKRSVNKYCLRDEVVAFLLLYG